MPQPRGKVGPYKRQEHKKKELEDKRNEMDKKEYKIHVKDTGGWVCLFYQFLPECSCFIACIG